MKSPRSIRGRLSVFLVAGAILAATGRQLAKADEPDAVRRAADRACVSAAGRPSIEDAKSAALRAAKRGVVEAILGNSIRSALQAAESSPGRDEIVSAAGAFVQWDGDPVYSQGDSLGDVCASISGRVSIAELAKLEPRPVKETICVSDGDPPSGDLEKTAKELARREAVLDHERRLAALAPAERDRLLHDVRIESAGFDGSATRFCVTMTGVIDPIVVLAIEASRGNPLAGMVRIDGAVFRMGSDNAERDWAFEKCKESGDGDCRRSWYEGETARTATVATFYLDRTEVTNDDFAAYSRAGNLGTRAEREGGHVWKDGKWYRVAGASWVDPEGDGRGLGGRGNHPVRQVTWDEALAYCAGKGKRLPTEDEWELAARGPEGRRFPWGDEWMEPDRAREGSSSTLPVDARPERATPDGLLGMAGNVWEWTSSSYEGNESRKVVRGGAFVSGPDYLRGAARYWFRRDTALNLVGFRCARDGGRRD